MLLLKQLLIIFYKSKTTLPEPSAPPSHVKCQSLSSNSLKVTWRAPQATKANGVITNYRITYALQNSDGNFYNQFCHDITQIHITDDHNIFLNTS